MFSMKDTLKHNKLSATNILRICILCNKK